MKRYFFPESAVTIEAESREEAEAKLAQMQEQGVQSPRKKRSSPSSK